MRVLLSFACLAFLLPQLAASPAARAADLDYGYAPPVSAPPIYERRPEFSPPPVAYEVPVRPYYRPYRRFYGGFYARPYAFHRPFVRPYGYGYGYRRYGYGY